MARLSVCLLLCLLLAPGPLPREQPADVPPTEHPVFLSAWDDGSPLPDNATLEHLARTNPIAFLENCLRRCQRELKGFECLFAKHERIDDKLRPPELLRLWFRDSPLSVKMQWLEGTGRAGAILYVKGENRDNVLIRPAGLLRIVGIVERPPDCPEARQNGRYPLPEFGIKLGMERTLASWVYHRSRGNLQVEYLGAKPIPELNNRVCHVLHRYNFAEPEDDGVTDLVLYFDQENWLQVGSVLRGENDRLIASYYFRDLHVNPNFKPDTFTRRGLP